MEHSFIFLKGPTIPGSILDTAEGGLVNWKFGLQYGHLTLLDRCAVWRSGLARLNGNSHPCSTHVDVSMLS